MNKKHQRGQIVVFILLIALLALTVGLSVATRTLQDLKETAVSDQSSRAFAAAEAGIEEALRQDLSNLITAGGTGNLTSQFSGFNDVSYQVSASGGGGGGFVSKGKVAKNDVFQVNLENADGSLYSGDLNVYWKASGENDASLVLAFVTQTGATYGISKYAYNSINRSNGFTAGTCSGAYTLNINAKSYTFDCGITVPVNNSKILRMKPFYEDTTIAVVPGGSGSLPSQTYTIRSEAETDGGVKRVIEVTKSIPALPPIFDYVLFSGSTTESLSK